MANIETLQEISPSAGHPVPDYLPSPASPSNGAAPAGISVSPVPSGNPAVSAVETIVRNLVAELTGVPQRIIDHDSVLRSDLMIDESNMAVFLNEIRTRFDLTFVDNRVIHDEMTIREVVDAVERLQRSRTAASPVVVSSNGTGFSHENGDSRGPVLESAPTAAAGSRTISMATFESIVAQLQDDATAVAYAKHLNPVLVALGKLSGWLTAFVRGEGNYLWNEAGERYLDFVAGCGSVNLGHNPPQIVAALREAIENQVPGFAQSSMNPLTARLAAKLSSLSPGGLEMVFFCNSGTETIEAAIKLARLSTGRRGLLYCQGAYHGKSLGALSITGHKPFQEPFQPLVPECVSVPYGHERVLQRALETRQFAAFVVEPIQGERGTIIPPAGYLQAAQRLCRESGTLFVVDEVQTGMGRTGALFACEHDGLEPDVLTASKSLGGGMLPIGATLIKREHWLRAYGSTDRFALHTTTFGGGSLACAAGLAALDALSDPQLLANVRTRGEQLLAGLRGIQEKYPKVVREVRGKGLLAGLQLHPLDEQLAGILQRAIESDDRPESKELIANPKALVASLPSTFLIESLFSEHKIYALMARSNPLTVRVQPPLTITVGEVDYFLAAVEQACEKLNNPATILGQIMAQSVK